MSLRATAVLLEHSYQNLLSHGLGRREALCAALFHTRDMTIGQIHERWLSAELIERLAAGDEQVRRHLQDLAGQLDDDPEPPTDFANCPPRGYR